MVREGKTHRVIQPGDAVTFVVWSSGVLPDRVASMARALEGVVAVGRARVGTVDVRAVEGASRPLPVRRGRVLAMSVLALDPEPLAHSPRHADVARTLLGGAAAMTSAAAMVRGMDPGDRLRIAGRGSTLDVEIGLVLAENDLFDHELVLPLTRVRGLGLSGTRAVLVSVRPRRAQDVRLALHRVIEGLPARIMRLDSIEPPSLLPLATVKHLFGEFSYRDLGGGRIAPDPAWVARSIVDYRVPVLGVVRCHRLVVPQLYYAMWEIRRRGLAERITSYDGCYVPRMQRGKTSLISRHAFGIAFDINAGTNGLGSRPRLDPRIVAVMERWGFAWGGRWLLPDGMHFEFVRFVRPAE